MQIISTKATTITAIGWTASFRGNSPSHRLRSVIGHVPRAWFITWP